MAIELNSTSCVNNCMDALVDRMASKLFYQNSDSAKAGLVREGRLQADPTKGKVNILVQQGGEEWPDILDTQSGLSGKGQSTPYETGGGAQVSHWRRRFQLELQMFFGPTISREQGRSITNVVVSRAMQALYTWNLGDAIQYDSIGEHAYDIEITKNYIDAGGGPGAYNWRGMLYLEFLTKIEPDNEEN